MKNFIVITLIVFATSAQADIFDNITNSFKNGNASEIAKYFNTNVDLTILNSEEVYSKAHAQQLLSDFFAKNTVKSFTIIHKGSKEGAKFSIGKLICSTGSFRIYFLTRLSGDNEFIQELRIEKEE